MKFFDSFKKYKTFAIVAVTAFAVLYFAFLFVIPNVINLNNYKKDIQKIVFDSAKLNIDASDIKIVTTPSLKAGVKIKDLKVDYPDGKNIANAKNLKVRISLVPLIFKTLQISDITADTPSLSLTYLRDGQLDIVKYIAQNIPAQEQSAVPAELPVKLSSKLPVVTVNGYKITLADEKTNNTLSLKGDNFVFDKAILNKHFRVSSNGGVFLNDSENVKFDIKIFSFMPAIETAESQQTSSEIPQIDFINELVKYSPKADVTADLTVKEHRGHLDLNGFVNADNVSIKLDGKRLPNSFLHVKSSGHKTFAESDLYITANEKAVLSAEVKSGRKTGIDLNVKIDRITFSSMQKFALALLNSLNLKNDLASLYTKGYVTADFTLKTDLKKFESSGFLKVLDGEVSHKTIPVKIDSIGADIDFSNNNVNIKKAIAVINGTQISAKGAIDSKSNADISIASGKINIAPLFNAFAPADLKNSYLLQSGILSANAAVKGPLAQVEPTVTVGLNSVVLKTKTSNPYIKIDLPKANVNVNPKEAVIEPFTLYFNNSEIDVAGSVKDFTDKMKMNISINGSIKSSDLKNLLPKETRTFIGSKGTIPVLVLITGNDKKTEIKAQAQSNASNHFSPVTVKKAEGKPCFLNFSAVYSMPQDKFDINDASLYLSSKTQLSPSDFAANKKGASKIAGLSGSVSSVLSSSPSVKIQFSIPENLLISTAFMPSAGLKARGDLNVAGTLNDLYYKGFFSIKDVKLPDFLTSVQDADLEFSGDTITAKVQNLDINGTSLNVDADASSKFKDVFVVKNIKVTSQNFNADNLFKAMDKMNTAMPPASSTGSVSSNAQVLPVKILKGVIEIQKFVMKQAGGNLTASDITGDFTLADDLFKLDNLKASVFNGCVKGNVTYNLKTTAVTAKIKGENVNANPAVTVFAGLKDQVVGNVNFNADVKLKGATYEQQMKSLNGKADFALKNGQMGSLGRFETFLKADNLLSQSFVSTKIGSLISAVSPYNTGQFDYLNGEMSFKNGTASLSPVKMSGAHMSLLITGDVNILSMISNLQILGSLSPQVVNALGPVADLSVEKFASYIPKFGAKIASALNDYNEGANKTELAKIPPLTPSKANTKAFKVVLNGNLNNPPSAVKKFQWLNTPEKIQEEQTALEEAATPKLPATKEELKEQIKEDLKQGVTNAVKNNEKVQEIQQNKAVKTFTEIYKFYKQPAAQE